MNQIDTAPTAPPGRVKVISPCISAALIGFFLVFGPVLTQPSVAKSIFAMHETAIKNLSSGQIFLFAVAGAFAQLILKPQRRFLVSLSSVAVLPILSLIEMAIDPGSHNLWPLEFMIYGFIGAMFFLGLRLGSFVRKKFARE